MKPIWLKLATWYAVLTGVLLVLWWTTQLAGVLPEVLAPVQLAWSHIAAEMLAAALLLCGALAVSRGWRGSRVLLGAGFGALAYAALNVMSDYSGRFVWQFDLAMSAVFALLGLAIVIRSVDDTGSRGL